MYTDASCEPSGDSFRVICCWWLVAGEVRTGGVEKLPAEVMATFGERKTLIGQWGSFAPLLFLWFHGEHVVDTNILLLVDSLGVVSMLLRRCVIEFRHWRHHPCHEFLTGSQESFAVD